MKSFIFALQYLTRIHLYSPAFDDKAFGRSGMFFPLVGLLLGGITAGVYLLAGKIFPPQAASAMVVVALVLLTGGLHLDGFMDTVDGVFSGRPREKKLEIMKDSRVGAFGALGVFCLLLLKYGLVAGLEGLSGVSALVIMTVTGRWAMTYALARFPYARQEGLGKLYSIYTGRTELAVASLTAVLVAAAAGGPGGILILAAGFLAAHLLCSYLHKVLGGLTGDTYGALNESLEVFVLALYLPLNNYAHFLFAW